MPSMEWEPRVATPDKAHAVSIAFFLVMLPAGCITCMLLCTLQFWRLFTNFFFMGKFSINWIVRFLWLLQYGTIVEGQTFQFEPAGFVFLMLFGMVSMLGISFACWALLNMPFYFNGSTMVFMLLYVWSRQFPDQQVSIYGLFKVLSFYVPFIWIGIDFLISGGIPWDSVAGIFIGHMHYYLTNLYPAVSGRNVLKTPTFLANLCADMGLGQRVNTHAATGQNAFSAFRGHGQRLGS